MKWNFVYLTEDQILGKQKLSILKKRGIQASTTDYARLSLCETYFPSFLEVGLNILDPSEYYGKWLLENDKYVYVEENKLYHLDETREDKLIPGIRPAIKLDRLDCIPGNIVRSYDGVLETVWGLYPQSVFTNFTWLRYELDAYYNIVRNYKSYNPSYSDYLEQIYGYTKNKVFKNPDGLYLNFFFNKTLKSLEMWNCRFTILSNGADLSSSQFDERYDFSLKIEPIKWLIDEEQKIMLSEKILFPAHNGLGYPNQDFVDEILQLYTPTINDQLIDLEDDLYNLNQVSTIEELTDIQEKVKKIKKVKDNYL